MPVECDDVIIFFAVPEHFTHKCGLLIRRYHAGNASGHHEHFGRVLFCLVVGDAEQFEIPFRISAKCVDIRLVPHFHIADASAVMFRKATDELSPFLRAAGSIKFPQNPPGDPGANCLQFNALLLVESNQLIIVGPVPFPLFPLDSPPADIFAEHFYSAPGSRHYFAFLFRQRKFLGMDADAEEKPFRPSRRRAGWFHVTIAEAL